MSKPYDSTSTPIDSLRLAAAVHDVNQMLTAILGRAELLRVRYPDAALVTHLDAIALAARDAVGMLDRLRGAPRGAEPSGTLVHQDLTHVAAVIVPPDGAWTTHAATGGAWRLVNEVPVDLALGLPAGVLREVLANLLHNALAVMPDGGCVTVSASVEAERARIRVADTGPGLDPDDTERIFEPGFTSTIQAGKGLGLTACRLLLADWKATLRAAGGRPGGAVFEIEAPRVDAAAVADNDAVVTVDGDGAAAPAMVVLVVDDEPAVREMLQAVFVELGCHVVTARNADEAGRRHRDGGIELALVDVSLPGVGGVELVRRLRGDDPDLVIALMTGLGNEQALATAADVPVDLTVTKPLDLAALRDLLRRAAATKRRRARDGGTSVHNPKRRT